MEILLAEGINDSEENLGRLKDFCQRLHPDRVDVVTLTRPGTVKGVRPVDGEALSRWRKTLSADTKRAVSKSDDKGNTMDMERVTAFIQASLARRPQTVLQLTEALGADRKQVHQAVEALLKLGEIVARTDGDDTFYHGSAHVIEEE